MNDSPSTPPAGDPADEQAVRRLVPVWLEEAARHDAEAAGRARQEWEQGRLSSDGARELADWVTARVTDTGFNEDEGPSRQGPAHVSVADKAAVHRWLAARGHDV
ncbi:hypothetical protein IQ279_09725 [Streptomyces verrucosisporus]|uniref:hypothetical protein n=1 Tax=Streptomyces verrucosisporus TaxID=1695161 RepID=UPI0019CF628A|nr:hypothetical protein [Streptomyces verrucosisporus]MBN3929915.1 hypothetical protein [Streptomyces verrucosisporus]